MLLRTHDCSAKRKPYTMVCGCRILWWPCQLSVPWKLNKSQTLSPTKRPDTCITCIMVETTQAGAIYSPSLHLIETQRLEPKISNLDSSHQRIDFHWSFHRFLCSNSTMKARFMQAPTNRWCVCLFELWEALTWALIWGAVNWHFLRLVTLMNLSSAGTFGLPFLGWFSWEPVSS